MVKLLNDHLALTFTGWLYLICEALSQFLNANGLTEVSVLQNDSISLNIRTE